MDTINPVAHRNDWWWFASTTCPLVASLLGPIGVVFSICALSSDWRTTTTHEDGLIADPRWLKGVLSVALISAVSANAALLLNITDILSFLIAQWLTIIGWFLSCSILTAVLVWSKVSPSFLDKSVTMGQPFYYAIFAASVLFTSACLLTITLDGALRGKYKKHLNLSVKQRSLMLQIIALLFYVLIGAAVFSHIEGWEYLNGVYWAVVTLLTIGFGDDFTPANDLARGLLVPYALFGIICLGLVVTSIIAAVVERSEKRLECCMEQHAKRLIERMNQNETEVRIGWFHKVRLHRTEFQHLSKNEREDRVKIEAKEKATRDIRWLGAIIAVIFAAIVWLGGAAVFVHAEGWSYFHAWYFSFAALLTIGYGDFSPATNLGRAFFVFWAMLAVPTVTNLVGSVREVVMEDAAGIISWTASKASRAARSQRSRRDFERISEDAQDVERQQE